RTSLYDFDTSRITSNGYLPQNATQPYIYIAAPSYLASCIKDASDPTATTTPPSVVPYMQDGWDANSDNILNVKVATGAELGDATGNVTVAQFQALCMNPKSFQLIAPGLDSSYGAASKQASAQITVNGVNKILWYKSYPSGLGYDTSGADNDNVTN